MDVESLQKRAPGTPITGTFLVRAKSIRQAKNGPYLSFVFGDRQGLTIEARQWQVAKPGTNGCEEGDIVDVQATVDVWNDNRQLRVTQLRPTLHKELSPFDFLPKAADGETQFAELQQMVAEIGNPHLRQLMKDLFSTELASVFRLSPASKLLHQARLGGLLEHTLGVARLCRQLAILYPGMDGDLLVCGALCHDLGKTVELSPVTLSYTTEGRLLGHTVLGLLKLQQHLATCDGFPEHLAAKLLHLVASHSGKLEWGAPAVPHTLEAWALHLADMVDSRLSSVKDTLASAGDTEWLWNELVNAEVWRPRPGREARGPQDP